jgi:tetratricopeptide (TPR) repeat protein
MPKQRRAAASRSIARPAAKKSSSKAPKALKLSKRAKVSKPSSKLKASKPSKSPKKDRPSGRTAAAAGVRKIAPKKEPTPTEVAAPAPPPRRPAFYEALAVYETGVRALQRHDFEAAADSLRGVIQGYPSERELVERARLYLQVCERETARRPSGPQTPSESVYAATVALNAGDVDGALGHLNRALERAPESDHAHYIMAVALVDKGDPSRALVHLRQAVTLNPDNRSVALQDPDLSALHDLDAFRQVLGTDVSIRRRMKARR